MNLSKSVKVMCAKRGTKQKELASGIGITNVYLSKMMTENKTGTDKLKAMADYFGVSVSEFVAEGEE